MRNAELISVGRVSQSAIRNPQFAIFPCATKTNVPLSV